MTIRRLSRVTVASIILFAVGSLSGCGCGSSDGTCTVSGKVSFKGKAVCSGIVNLVSADGRTATGAIEATGAYLVNNAPTGLVKIGVVSDKPFVNVRSVKPEPGAPPPPPPPNPANWFLIDAKYNDPATSGKEMTLTSGSNSQDIVLE